MVLIFQWICFWLISESDSVYGSTHAVIGNYTQLNPKECGISRTSVGYNDLCLQWHKSPLPLKEGRDALTNEVPSFVTIIIPNKNFWICGGSIIAKQWILTARHCLISTNLADYQIAFGSAPITGGKTLPVIELHPAKDNGTDLALLKLDREVNSTQLLVPVNSICLPKPLIIPEEPEYALTVGRGQTDWRKEAAQVGYRKIITNYTGIPFGDPNYPEFNWLNISNMIFTVTSDKQALLCKGDSGGPLWQYKNGRAVLIGVLVGGANSVISKCNEFHNISTDFSGFMRVAQYIDWIKDITKLN